MVWHIGNVAPIGNEGLYFRLGRTVKYRLEFYKDGIFSDQEFEGAPYTHVILDFCWDGVLKLRSSEGIRVPRGRYAKIYEKFIISGRLIDKFMENYTIIAGDRQFGYKRGKLSGLTSVREVPKNFFNCGGQGCRIISDQACGLC